MTKNKKLKITEQFYVIPNALDIKIKDQGKRPTCAAFAGVRAIETLMAANDVHLDLAEQFLYWASKPQCQKSPCSKKGSWISEAFLKSQNAKQPDIPLEENCPYEWTPFPNNETQIPLQKTCVNGQVKIHSFYRLSNFQETLRSISEGHPVVAGFRLSPNFYFSRGLIKSEDSKTQGPMDSHANGHAVVLIGHIKLPPHYKKSEGDFCLIVANSWGEGWATGGFGCISENWFKKHLIKNALLALNSTLTY